MNDGQKKHPIEGLMDAALHNIKEMVDVNTIIGDPIVTPDGATIVPVSKVSFGFGSGGTDISFKNPVPEGRQAPFGGGSMAGISISPVAFLVLDHGNVKLMHITDKVSSLDRAIELLPELMEKFKKNKDEKAEKKPQEADRPEPTPI